MECQRCTRNIPTPSAHYSHWTGGFYWNHLCRWCKDQLKLEDWNKSCTPLIREKD